MSSIKSSVDQSYSYSPLSPSYFECPNIEALSLEDKKPLNESNLLLDPIEREKELKNDMKESQTFFKITGVNIKELPYFKESLQKISRSVIESTSLILEQISKSIQPKIRFALATTGSDGRFEKGSNDSPLEIILITHGNKEEAEKLKLLFLKTITSEKDTRDLIYPDIESKDVSQDKHFERVSLHVSGKTIKVIPTRPLDSLFLYGDSELFQDYKKEFILEIIENKVDIKRFRKDFVDYSIRTLKKDISGKPHRSHSLVKSGVQFVDYENGLLFYNGVDVKSVKYGALRSIQYSIAYHIFLYMSKLNKKEALHLINELPKSTDERISFLSKKGIINLSGTEARELQETYLQLLSIYTKCQESFREQKQGSITLKIDKKQLQELIDKALALCEKIMTKSKPKVVIV